MHGFLLFVVALIFGFSMPVQAGDHTIVINGSSSFNNFLFHEHKDDIQLSSAIDFEVLTTSSGRGLRALAEGRADIAMVSSTLGNLIAGSQEKGIQLDAADYDIHEIGQTKAILIVHKDNPIQSLTKELVKDLFTGNITDWSALGVDNIGAVKVVTEHPTGGVYNTVVNKVLDGEAITDNRVTMQNGPQVALIISQMREGFGFLSDATPEAQRLDVRVVSAPDIKAAQELLLLTKKGDSRPEILELIEAIKAYADNQ